MTDEVSTKLSWLGLVPRVLEETLKSPKLTQALLDAINEVLELSYLCSSR